MRGENAGNDKREGWLTLAPIYFFLFESAVNIWKRTLCEDPLEINMGVNLQNEITSPEFLFLSFLRLFAAIPMFDVRCLQSAFGGFDVQSVGCLI
jgi:hypothetical protein